MSSPSAGLDCGFHKGGAIYFAVNDGQLERTRHHHAQLVRYGLGDAWALLDADASAAIVHLPGVLGALFTTHAAALNPARLARGLAVEVERLGGAIHEQTAVLAIEPGGVLTDHGRVRGVAAANAAGRGLADLIRGVDSDLVHLPWVGHRSRPWEREPLRWLGVHAANDGGPDHRRPRGPPPSTPTMTPHRR